MVIMKKILKNAPLLSMLEYLNNGNIEDMRKGKSSGVRFLKFLGHMVYGLTFVAVFGGYVSRGVLINEWNPSKQKSALNKLRCEGEAEQEKYNSLYRRLFDANGLADANRDGHISYDEQFNVWSRMGLIDLSKVYFESNGSRDFQTPKVKDLEKAVKSYEVEQRH